MKPSIRANVSGFRQMARELAKFAPGVPLRQIIRQQGGTVLSKAGSYTPPRSLSQGRKAVARDIKKAVGDIDPRKVKNPELKKALQRQDYAALQTILPRMRFGYSRVERFQPVLHTTFRNRRGRVARATGTLALPRAEVRRYSASMQKKVGLARASWVAVGRHLGLNVRAPGWVMRNVPTAARYVSGSTEKMDQAVYYLQIHNTASHLVKGLRGQNYLDRAIRDRVLAFNRDVRKGVFADLDMRARRYPGIFVR